MVGAGPEAELLDDRLHDRIGRDRAGQALENAGEALGFGATARLEVLDGDPVTDGGEADDHDQDGDRPVAEAGIDPQPDGGEQAEDEERTDEGEP